MPKTKRVWTDEQKKAVGDRLKAGRLAKQSQTAVAEPPHREVSPEVQAVIDTMTPERKAKLQAIQARNLANLSQTKEGREALERLEARHNPVEQFEVTGRNVPVVAQEFTSGILSQIPPEPPKPVVREIPMKVPFRLTGSISGLMISELSLCLCGEQRLKWHPVCLKVKVNG